MQIDSFKPVLIKVTIDGSALGGTAPQDGFIDPTTIQRYLQLKTVTGTEAAPVVAEGDTVEINGVAVTFTGTSLSDIVDDINALTHVHHVIASDNGGLELVNETLYENFGITLTSNDPAVVTALGFDEPVVADVNSQVSTFDLSLTKSRANRRWDALCKLVGFEASPFNVGAVVKDAGSPDVEPTEISFVISYYSFHSIYSYNENGDLLKGLAAVKHMVAKALVNSEVVVVPVMDPTTVTPPTPGFERGMRATKLEVGALAADIATAEAAITIETIPSTR